MLEGEWSVRKKNKEKGERKRERTWEKSEVKSSKGREKTLKGGK